MKKKPDGRKPGGKAGSSYQAPALEKGLDILECLAEAAAPLSLAEVATILGRSTGEIFRMMEVLRRRGFLRRDAAAADRFVLTPRMFQLAHRQPSMRGLLDAALPVMRGLAEAAGQSCHLAIRHGMDILVTARVESPGEMGFSVRVGTSVPMVDSASGRVLLAWQPPDLMERWLEQAAVEGVTREQLAGMPSRAVTIRRRGYERRPSGVFRGITDLSAPVLDHRGHAVAALTIPYIASIDGAHGLDRVVRTLCDHAAGISDRLGGPGAGDDGAVPFNPA